MSKELHDKLSDLNMVDILRAVRGNNFNAIESSLSNLSPNNLEEVLKVATANGMHEEVEYMLDKFPNLPTSFALYNSTRSANAEKIVPLLIEKSSYESIGVNFKDACMIGKFKLMPVFIGYLKKDDINLAVFDLLQTHMINSVAFAFPTSKSRSEELKKVIDSLFDHCDYSCIQERLSKFKTLTASSLKISDKHLEDSPIVKYFLLKCKSADEKKELSKCMSKTKIKLKVKNSKI